ncbi:hypothetical protein AMECASPLE_026622 [Ameca splendens]|uniref:Uncharacterized protein n=1 Tax=Ameca splendens TaxID=208324 RepID=A0ABV0ZPU3_9TELE
MPIVPAQCPSSHSSLTTWKDENKHTNVHLNFDRDKDINYKTPCMSYLAPQGDSANLSHFLHNVVQLHLFGQRLQHSRPMLFMSDGREREEKRRSNEVQGKLWTNNKMREHN